MRGSMPPCAWEWPPVARGGGVCWNPSPQDALSISELTPAPCMTAPHLAPVYTSAKSSTTHQARYGNCPLLVCAPCTSSLAVSKYLLVGVHTFGITLVESREASPVGWRLFGTCCRRCPPGRGGEHGSPTYAQDAHWNLSVHYSSLLPVLWDGAC